MAGMTEDGQERYYLQDEMGSPSAIPDTRWKKREDCTLPRQGYDAGVGRLVSEDRIKGMHIFLGMRT